MDLDIELWGDAAIVVAAVFGSAILSALRSAIARASRAAVIEEARAGRVPATRPRARLIGALMVGSIVLTIGATAFATSVLTERNGPVGVVWAAILMSLVVVYVEAAARLSFVQDAVALVLVPFGFRIGRHALPVTPDEEIRGQVDLLHRQGTVVKEDRDMLGGLLDLKELQVGDVMIHRTRMRTVEADLPTDAIVREALASPHTRLPLWRDSPENIVGVLHAKDLFRATREAGAAADPLALASPPWFVPDTTSLRDQLRAFLSRKQHFALVVDEYGDLMGLVTLEDILEEIVGDISDEHDVAVRGIRPQPDGSVLVDGAMPIRDLNRSMGWELPDEEAVTVAGLVIHEAQTIPEPGQAFTFHGVRFEVLRRVRNRVAALRLRPEPRRSSGPDEPPAPA